MKILTKYLRVTIVSYIALVMLLLLGLQAFIEFMREFPNIGTGSYGLLQVLEYVPLMLPFDVYQLFPMAGLLGCVIALGLLASHSELIVMRTAGVTLIDITIAVAKAATFLIVIMIFVGEVVAPIAQSIAIRHKTRAMSAGQTLVTYQGIWMRSGKDFIHVDAISDNKELQGVTRYEFDTDNKLKATSVATNGSYQNGNWIFTNVMQTIFADNKTTSTTFPQQQWELNLNPHLVGIVHVDADQKSLPMLYSYIEGRKQSGLNARSYEFIFWQRLFSPLASLVMILLAVPFVFGPLRSTTMGLRMLVGIMFGFCFYIFDQFVGSMSVVSQVSPALAAVLPIILFAFVGGFLLLKTK